MNADTEFEHAALTHQIIGAAMEVLNTLGHGFHEKPYEQALLVELGLRGLACDQQRSFPICYKGVDVGVYIPDLVVNSCIVTDTKVVDRITDHERGQMINYLRISMCEVGLIINFSRPKLEWERIVLRKRRSS
jgi:GxxExxY protein